MGVQKSCSRWHLWFYVDSFVYDGKNSAELDDGEFGQLQKCVQVVEKLCDDLRGHKNYIVFFDNWFTTLDLLHHFRSKRIHAVGTIGLNRLRGCPLDANKDLKKNARGAMDYRCDSYSGIMAVKWVDNSVVNLTSNFVELSQLGSWKDRVEKGKVRKNIPYPQIIQQYKKAWEVLTWRTCCYHCIEYHARQSAGTKRYSGISLIWKLILIEKSLLQFSFELSDRQQSESI